MTKGRIGRREVMVGALGALTAACKAKSADARGEPQRSLPLGVAMGSEARKRSTCRYCPAACPMDVRMVEGRAVRVAGAGGALCPTGIAAIQGLNHPHRVQTPMIRVGEPGSGLFRPATSDEALTLVLGHLRAAMDASTGAIVFSQGTLSEGQSALLTRLMTAMGGKMPKEREGVMSALRQAVGMDGGLVYDFSQVDYVLTLGPACTVPSAHWPGFSRAWARQHRPRLGMAAARLPRLGPIPDDAYLVQPGREALFALALANGLCRVLRNSEDAKTLFPVVDPYPPNRVADLIGIPESSIISCVAALARSRAVVVADENPSNPSQQVAAVLLNRVLGAWGSSVRVAPPLQFPMWPALNQPPGKREGNPSVGILVGDGVASPPMEHAEFTVAVTSILENGARHADVVLPSPHFFEAWDCKASADGKVAVQPPVQAPRFDCRPIGDWILAIAKGLGYAEAFPWDTYEQAIKNGISGAPTASGATSGDPADVSDGSRPGVEPRFELPASLSSPLDVDTDFPFGLVPALDGRQAVVPPWIRELPAHVGNPNDAWVEITPGDARRLGLVEGERVQVETPRRTLPARVRIREGLRPGVLAMANTGGEGKARIRGTR